MSELQKKIARILRREGPAIGFGARTREVPKAMLLAALAEDEKSARAVVEAGADAVVFKTGKPASITGALQGLMKDKIIAGAWLESLEAPQAEELAKAGCDFVISPLESTASSAVDAERMGQLIVATSALDDTTLRSLGPLGLDGLVVELPPGTMKLKDQLALVRLASFSSTQLVVRVDAEATPTDLRVLRDSGAAAILAPAGASADQIKALVEALRAVPPPKKGKEGREIALVPSMAAAAQAEEEDEEDDE